MKEKRNETMTRSQLYKVLQNKKGVALISLYNKNGVIELAQRLIALNWGILASAGTVKVLESAGIEAYDVAIVKGRGPSSGHLVVTISDEIANALLSKTPEALLSLKRRKIPRIDLVWVDPYPLEETVSNPGCTQELAWKSTDIGARVLLIEAAKGGRLSAFTCEQMDQILRWLESGKPDEQKFISDCAWRADAKVAEYSAISAAYHSHGVFRFFSGLQAKLLRYGENPFQTPAYLFATDFMDPLATYRFETVDGKSASFINETDLDRLLAYICRIAAGYEINVPSYVASSIAVAVKHGNACGVGVGGTPIEALKKMVKGDPRAIFGGVVMTNFTLGTDEATVLRTFMMPEGTRRNLDSVIAPSFTLEAIEILSRKDERCRMVQNKALGGIGEHALDMEPFFRHVRGGFLMQPNYNKFVLDISAPQIQKFGQATPKQERDMIIAWAIASLSNSNTIAIVLDETLLGNGVGQQDRVGGCELAVGRAIQANHNISGASAASDSFFPFPDGVEALAEAGVKAIFTTSGSMNDHKTIQVCKEKGIILYMIPDKNARGFSWH